MEAVALAVLYPVAESVAAALAMSIGDEATVWTTSAAVLAALVTTS